MAVDTAAAADASSGAGMPATDDYLDYLKLLRDLDDQAAAVNTALLEAHIADGAQARREAIVELHTRLRRMAAAANDALGRGVQPDGVQP